MQELQIFKNDLFEIAVKLDNGEVVFDAEKVSKSLGFTEVKNGKEYVMWRRVNNYLKPFGTNAETNSPQVEKGDLIPEAAVYKLAFKASNEVAEKFQDWLAIDVIPSIRKHGAYMTDNTLEQALLSPDFLIQLATNLKEEKQKRIAAEKHVEIMKPKAEFYDDVAGSKDAIAIGEVAKILGIKGLGRNKLFEVLRQKKILQPNNQPYQTYCDRGYFRVIEQKFETKGEIKINIKTLVYQKGIDYIRKVIKEEV